MAECLALRNRSLTNWTHKLINRLFSIYIRGDETRSCISCTVTSASTSASAPSSVGNKTNTYALHNFLISNELLLHLITKNLFHSNGAKWRHKLCVCLQFPMWVDIMKVFSLLSLLFHLFFFWKARSTIIVILMNNIARWPKKPLKLLTLGGKE